MRVLGLALAVIFAACTNPSPVTRPTPTPTREPNLLGSRHVTGTAPAWAELAPAELDPVGLRQRLETRTFAGIVTQYTFGATHHAGFAARALVMLSPDARGVPGLAPSPTPSPTPTPSASPSPTSSP
ncbi:MAG: hypothetical protein AAB295_08930 [Chloroflexota bacterium]